MNSLDKVVKFQKWNFARNDLSSLSLVLFKNYISCRSTLLIANITWETWFLSLWFIQKSIWKLWECVITERLKESSPKWVPMFNTLRRNTNPCRDQLLSECQLQACFPQSLRMPMRDKWGNGSQVSTWNSLCFNSKERVWLLLQVFTL